MAPPPPESPLASTLSSLTTFLTLTKANHFILYLPYNSHSLLSFLTSCFHRSVVHHLTSTLSFHEVAVFTEPTYLGRTFVLFSKTLNDKYEFGLENSRALQQEGGVFGRVFGMEEKGLMPAWVVGENRLVVVREGFWEKERMEGRWGGEAETGAGTLLVYAGIVEGVYDIRRQMFLSEVAPHQCETHGDARWMCSGRLDSEETLPDWEEVFPPPWDKPYSGIFRMAPYMALNILTSELGPLVEKTSGSSQQSVPPAETLPATSSHTMENADKIIRRARQSIHEFSLLKRSFSPRLQHHQYGSSSSSLNNPQPHPRSNTSPVTVPSYPGPAEDHSPAADHHRSHSASYRSSPLPAFQDSSRPPPSMDVTQMLLDELRRAKTGGPGSTAISAKLPDPSPGKSYESSLGTSLLQRLGTSSYGEIPKTRETESDSDASSEDGARSQTTIGKRVEDVKNQRVEANLGIESGSTSLSALDPSTLDMLVRKLEAVKDSSEVGQGANAGSSSGKTRRRRKKRPQAVGEDEGDGVRERGEIVG
ncbi:hypothetical protein QBC34DRAFT_385651 [Podospora aff. communis PSN243]|uniref:Uncharacterized protein n=1 Tax=Podospora aff. communis PSN243 TaxID=3040156 RepID=A0AAV9G7H9_9PEZI|nr:hypothetical protein QBC34DRAFT_385651 [Podospora aff. communis PSN243]